MEREMRRRKGRKREKKKERTSCFEFGGELRVLSILVVDKYLNLEERERE